MNGIAVSPIPELNQLACRYQVIRSSWITGLYMGSTGKQKQVSPDRQRVDRHRLESTLKVQRLIVYRRLPTKPESSNPECC